MSVQPRSAAESTTYIAPVNRSKTKGGQSSKSQQISIVKLSNTTSPLKNVVDSYCAQYLCGVQWEIRVISSGDSPPNQCMHK